MNEDLSTVNSQIVDATTSIVTLAAGQSPSQAFAMLDTVLLETLGIAMYNAVNRQQGAGMLSAAAVTSTCAKMLSVPFPVATTETTPTTTTPPSVSPLPSPPRETLSPAAVVAAATTEAENALAAMKQQAEDTQKEAQKVQQDMQKLAEAAGTLGSTTTVPDPGKNTDTGTSTQDTKQEPEKKPDAS